MSNEEERGGGGGVGGVKQGGGTGRGEQGTVCVVYCSSTGSCLRFSPTSY